MIPARLERCDVPDPISELQWVDLFEADGFEYLAQSLAFEIGKRQPQTEPEVVEQALVAEPTPAPRQKPRRVREPEAASPTVVEPRQLFEPELILIPAGEFLMGSDPDKDKNAGKYEQLQHRLSLPDYFIAKTPVTNAQYLAFVAATGHRKPRHWKAGKIPEDKEDHPVVYVTWHDAMAYCQWLAEATGKTYRLPSEAEWEKAARGTDGRIYPWGDEWDAKRCNTKEGGSGGTTPVGRYSPSGDSPFVCADMAGNVWEWTRSLWGKDWEEPDFRYPYHPKDSREDLKAGDDILRVLRSGSWYFMHYDARCACRLRYLPYSRLSSDGFRVCVAAQQE